MPGVQNIGKLVKFMLTVSMLIPSPSIYEKEIQRAMGLIFLFK